MKRIGLVTLLSFLAFGCGNNSVPPVLMHLQVTPGTASVAAGFQVTLTATAVYSDGRHEDVTSTATWTSSDPAVASVAAGVVKSKAPGQVQVLAAYDAFRSAVGIRVTDAVLVGLVVKADVSDVPKGTTVRARATGLFSDGATRDLSDQVAWSTASGRLAFVSPGLARAMALGPDRLVATHGDLDGGADVNVTAALLVSVELRILEGSLPKGATTRVVMEATFTDDSVLDVTGDTVFDTEDDAIVTVVGPDRMKAVAEGLSEVTGVYQGMRATAQILVTEAEPLELLLQPPVLELAVGSEATLLAVGTYTDECERDDTEDVTWISSDPSVASVSNVCGCAGEVVAVAQGQATVTATHVEQGVSATAVVVVVAPVLKKIVIMPLVPTVAVGATLQLTALGTFSDGSKGDVTGRMTWTSWSPGLIWVDRGLVTGLSPGQGTVQAQDPANAMIVYYRNVTVY